VAGFTRPPFLKRSVFLLQNRLDLLGERPLDQPVGFLVGHRLRTRQNLHEDGGHVTIIGRHVATKGDLARAVDQDNDRIVDDTVLLSSYATGVALDPRLVEREDERCFLERE
jgi:hypothetical protein